MKRLLTLGIGDIFQMGHVFREGEVSARHNPEFTMVEWYRHTTDFSFFIEETAEFIRLFLGNLPHKILSYRDAFRLFAQVDYLCAETEDLLQCIASHGIEIHFNETWDKDTLCYLIMSSIIEPHLGKEEILFLTDYPSSQAALAQTEQKGDEIVAKRFEIFHQGIELANGYLELIDPNEQRKRFLEANSQRVKAGKQALPLDELFLAALKKGMPSCCGVAVGFDRLMMLRHQAKSLSEVIAFAWDEV
jgi:lysyl-tRNA synthetase class 2